VGDTAQRIPRHAIALVVAAAALPRLLALAIERHQILEAYVEKSDTFAQTLVSSGTFGFLPGVPSAYTQPLYAWFLAALYWPLERSWAVVGLAILSNARLLLLPLVLAPYVAWRVRPARRAVLAAVLVVVGAAAVTAPWVIRNEVVIGCATITTDTRALWKANNPATYDVLARGGWIDDVPDLPNVPPWPEKAAGISVAAAKAVDECAQASFYRDEVFDFWRDHPGEKGRLAVQAVGMLWSPFLSVAADDPGQQGLSNLAQRTVEPAFVMLLYAFALWGAFLAPRRFVVLAALLLGFNTLMAMAFAGTVRYRAPWDFVLALLAAFAVERAWELVRRRRAPAAASAAP
jgi:hypothetical protein